MRSLMAADVETVGPCTRGQLDNAREVGRVAKRFDHRPQLIEEIGKVMLTDAAVGEATRRRWPRNGEVSTTLTRLGLHAPARITTRTRAHVCDTIAVLLSVADTVTSWEDRRMKGDIYTLGHVENAMIIWEWMVENRNKEPAGPFQRRYDYEGIADMRILAASLAIWAEDVWRVLPEYLGGLSFDWEVLPAILERIDWDSWPLALPDPLDAIDAVSRTFGAVDSSWAGGGLGLST